MKKLGKLQINPEKLMKNEELVTLRGGYGDNCCKCYVGVTFLGVMVGTTKHDCSEICNYAWNPPHPESFGNWSC